MMNIEDKILTKQLDENIVTKSEMMEAIDRNAEKHAEAFKKSVEEVKDSVKDIKSSNRWTIGTVISILSIAIAVVSLVLHAL